MRGSRGRHDSAPAEAPEWADDASSASEAVGRGAAAVQARLAVLLTGCVPAGYEVRVGRTWTPNLSARSAAATTPTSRPAPTATAPPSLHPDVAVHRTRAPGQGLDESPPVLCIDIADSTDARAQRRDMQAYAQLGVDHYWVVQPRRGALEVFVRTGAELRHAETLSSQTDRAGRVEWVDFGVGVVSLDLAALLRPVQTHTPDQPNYDEGGAHMRPTSGAEPSADGPDGSDGPHDPDGIAGSW